MRFWSRDSLIDACRRCVRHITPFVPRGAQKKSASGTNLFGFLAKVAATKNRKITIFRRPGAPATLSHSERLLEVLESKNMQNRDNPHSATAPVPELPAGRALMR